MAGMFKKALLHEKKLENHLKFEIFQSASRLKIQVHSFLTASTVSEN